ncbi:hypothetical protein [Serratia sp. BIGb0163]|uniref:hypothetical protein n=1 Tax=Serratia sp. BIGb0163 TaxID=2940613 RepID=UPI002167C09A|nr:hypothetical protein [Serratia sp. BIGb0163]MCS4265033.1 hypothetical protein [Serratia sp. BIGb0163]
MKKLILTVFSLLGFMVTFTCQSGNELTAQQKQLLMRMGSDNVALDDMSKACVLVGEGYTKKASELLGGIDWEKTSIKVKGSNVSIDGIVDYFMSHTKFDKESCDDYSRTLFNDSLTR